MQAIVYDTYGSPSVLSLQEIELPSLGAHDVLVRVHAASVNSWDRDNLLGTFPNRGMLGWQRPTVRVLGGDIAGRVEAIGGEVKRLRVGDEVLGDLSTSGWGAFAEYARAPESALTHKPPNLGFAEAAALPQAAVMALQGIRDHGQVRAGQRVLINGAGGGVGSFAVQLALLQGAEVTGVDKASKLALIRSLGATHALDYQTQDYTRTGQRYDFILDCELHRSPLSCLRALSPQGKVTIVGGAIPRLLQALLLGQALKLGHGRKLDILMHEANRNLAELAELAATGKLRAAIDRTYTLAEVPAALQRMCDGEVVGKVVVVMRFPSP